MQNKSQIPPLTAIRAFEAASRHLSFTRAGEELGMTQAAVSYQIKILEEKLGFSVFLRHPRRITLTEQGEQLAAKIHLAFDTLREAFEEVGEKEGGQLVVSSNTTFAVNWLAQRLVHFQMQNTDLAVRIVPYGLGGEPDFAVADVSVSACYAPPKGWISHEVVAARFTPMLCPALVESIGGISEPRDLLKLNIIDPHDPWWAIWFEAAGVTDIDLRTRVSSRMGSQALEANRAIAGQGVAILTPYFCKTALETGQLVQPFDLVCELSAQSWMLSYSPLAKNNRKVLRFRDWVFGELYKDGMPVPDFYREQMESGFKRKAI